MKFVRNCKYLIYNIIYVYKDILMKFVDIIEIIIQFDNMKTNLGYSERYPP